MLKYTSGTGDENAINSMVKTLTEDFGCTGVRVVSAHPVTNQEGTMDEQWHFLIESVPPPKTATMNPFKTATEPDDRSEDVPEPE